MCVMPCVIARGRVHFQLQLLPAKASMLQGQGLHELSQLAGDFVCPCAIVHSAPAEHLIGTFSLAMCTHNPCFLQLTDDCFWHKSAAGESSPECSVACHDDQINEAQHPKAPWAGAQNAGTIGVPSEAAGPVLQHGSQHSLLATC